MPTPPEVNEGAYFRQLVDLSAAQDVEAGDGTTSVVVLAGSLLGAAEKMLNKGIHPTIIAESFLRASAKAVEYLTEISVPVNLDDNAALLRAATTSLNSKVNPVPSDFYLSTLMACPDRITIFLNPCPNRRPSRPPPRHPNVLECRFARYPYR